MGGPWVGTLTWGGAPVADDVLIDSALVDDRRGHLYFARYYAPTRWRNDVFFRVCRLGRDPASVCEIRDSQSLNPPQIRLIDGGLYLRAGTAGYGRSLDPDDCASSDQIGAHRPGAV